MGRSLFSKLHRIYGEPVSLSDKIALTSARVDTLKSSYPLEMVFAPGASAKISAKKVYIVGGGFAGLVAAWWLTNHGFQVELFEASDHLGGRVLSKIDHATNRTIEAGAELIGRNHPAWLMFARKFNLGLSVVTSEDQYSYEHLELPLAINGKRIGVNQQETLYEEMNRALTSLNSDAAQVNAHNPWKCAKAIEWDHKTVADWLDRLRGHSQDCLAAIRLQLENDQTVPLEKQSYLGLLAAVKGGALTPLSNPKRGPSEFWTETEVFRCATGNQELAVAFGREIEKLGGKVRLNSMVATIDITSKDATVTVEKIGPQPAADWVVLAAPPSVWEKIKFAGPGRIQMGNAIKYLSSVDGRFWLSRNLAPSASSDRLGMVWEGTDNQNLPSEAGAELTVFAGSDAANRAINAPDVKEYMQGELESLFPGYRDSVTGSSFQNWPAEPWANAGYSCPAPGQVTTLARELVEPKGRLVFAGEHTCMAFFGYMEGALESGLRAAHTIALNEGVSEAIDVPEHVQSW